MLLFIAGSTIFLFCFQTELNLVVQNFGEVECGLGLTVEFRTQNIRERYPGERPTRPTNEAKVQAKI